MPRSRIFLLFISIPAFSLFTLAQEQTAPPKPQTARQALIEMVTGGEQAMLKHLSVEVQQSLQKAGNKTAAAQLAMFDAMKSEPGLQTFETGPVLLSVTDPKQNEKVEVQVDNDDLSGDEDALELSVYMFRDGQEQNNEWGILSPRFVVGLKQQQNIWRLNKITASAEFPLGDPKFLEKILGNGAVASSGMYGVHVGGRPAAGTSGSEDNKMSPQNVVTMLGFAENTFASQHAEVGFTCSFSDLTDTSFSFGLDPKIGTSSYNGYKFALTGCEGKPAGSFQVIAEPLARGRGAKAFCTDATHNIRVADDGRGATCLASGHVHNDLSEDLPATVGIDVHVHDRETKPKD